MSGSRSVLVAFALPAAVWAASAGPAQAVPLDFSGSFQGTVQADALPLGFTPPHPESFWDGAAVTGSFEVRVVDPQYAFGADPHVGFTDPTGYLKLAYTINGESFVYEAGMVPGSVSTPSIELGLGASGQQQVDFRTSFQPKYYGGTVSFFGSNLFTGFDPTTISLGSGLTGFATSFADPNAAMYFDVTVDRFSVSAVPEPATWALFALGGVALALTRRLRRHAAASGATPHPA